MKEHCLESRRDDGSVETEFNLGPLNPLPGICASRAAAADGQAVSFGAVIFRPGKDDERFRRRHIGRYPEEES